MTDNTGTSEIRATPAGWYDDPFGRARWRWFDGTQWTAYSSQGPTVLTDPDPSIAAPFDEAPDRRRGIIAVVSLIVLLGAAFVVFALSGPDDSDQSSSEPATGDVASQSADDGGSVADDPDSAPLQRQPGVGPLDAPSVDGIYDPESFDETTRRLKIVYEVENNNGERFERVVVSDLPRTLYVDDGNILYRDLDSTISCVAAAETCTDTGFGGNGFPPFSFYYGGGGDVGADREIAGRQAACERADDSSGLDWEACYDIETQIQLSYYPGADAMEPGVFTSEAFEATYFGPPDDADFDLPYPVRMAG